MTGDSPMAGDRLRETLIEWGFDALTADPPHSWRCAYYKDIDPAKGGGPCDCFDRLLNDLTLASEPETRATPEATADAAWDTPIRGAIRDILYETRRLDGATIWDTAIAIEAAIRAAEPRLQPDPETT